jgi:hypothetical protein
MKTCPFCAEEIQDQATVCRHCGRDLVARPSVIVAPAPAASQEGCFLQTLNAGCVFVVVGILVLGAGCGLIFLFGLRESANRNLTSPVASSSPSATGTGDTAPPRSGNAAYDGLQKLSAPNQMRLVATVIRSAGEPCPAVSRIFLQGFAPNREAILSAACTNDRSFMVKLDADPKGSTTVLNCTVAALVKTKCFEKFVD